MPEYVDLPPNLLFIGIIYPKTYTARVSSVQNITKNLCYSLTLFYAHLRRGRYHFTRTGTPCYITRSPLNLCKFAAVFCPPTPQSNGSSYVKYSDGQTTGVIG